MCIIFFPNPNLTYKFSFKNLYIGVAGRFAIYPTHLYGDPATWNIGYEIEWKNNELEMSTCQYIFLDNYCEFQIEEEHSKELTVNYKHVICKLKKHAGQPIRNPEEKARYCEHLWSYSNTESKYNIKMNTEEKMEAELQMWEKSFSEEYNPRISEACNKILKKRAEDHIVIDEDPIIKEINKLLENEESAEKRSKAQLQMLKKRGEDPRLRAADHIVREEYKLLKKRAEENQNKKPLYFYKKEILEELKRVDL